MLDGFRFGGIEVYINESYNNDRPRIHIYPNPVKDFLEIKTDDENIINIKIVSVLGITLLEKKGLNLESIDLTGIKPGIYLVICKGIENDLWAYKIQKI